MSRPEQTAGRGDAGNVPASVAAGVSPHVRDRFRVLALECVRSAERGEMVGASLALLSVLADKAIRGGVSA